MTVQGDKRALILTWGCQMNEHDSEVMQGYLQTLGYGTAERPEDADLILLNTCCIRESAEQKVLGKIGEFKRLKDRRPDLILGVAGCMPQQPHMAERLRQRAPHLDLILGTHNLHRLPELVQRAERSRGTVTEIWEESQPVPEEFPVLRTSRVTAWVTISVGCDNYCSYCIVPYVRGHEKSRPVQAIREEVESLAREGYKEVTLLGQNVNSYGGDLPDQPTFAQLLTALEDVEGLARIRYTAPHPREFTDELIAVHARRGKVCEHFHLPVQSGSNRVLERMLRDYTREDYLDLIRRCREAVPDATFTTDIIVGFPGETEEDFQQTLDLVRRVRFDKAHMFLFSPRPGTPAAEMPDQVPLEVRKERLHRLMAVQDAISREKNEALLGREVEVLVEGPSKTDPAFLSGRTRGNKLVLFPGSPDDVGRLRRVRVVEARTWTLEGRLVPEEGRVAS